MGYCIQKGLYRFLNAEVIIVLYKFASFQNLFCTDIRFVQASIILSDIFFSEIC